LTLYFYEWSCRMPEETSPIRVALADDHAVFREGVKLLLSLEDDIEVVAIFENGLQVVEAIDDLDAEILLLDLRMPGLDGLDTLHRLSERNLKLKIVVLTASEDQDQYVRALTYGAAGVMLKQSATVALPDCIRRVVNGEIWLDDQAIPLPDGQDSSIVPS